VEIATFLSLQIPTPFIRLDMLKSGTKLIFSEATPRPGKYHLFNEYYDRRLGEAYRKAEARLFRDLIAGKKFTTFCELFPLS